MPCDENDTTFLRKIFVINNVDFSEPDANKRPRHTANPAIDPVDTWVTITLWVFRPAHAPTTSFYLLSSSPA
jgi:hypothetical protein